MNQLNSTAVVVELSAIAESHTNPRKHFHPQKLKELADSIRKRGVLQPILVRPHPRPKNGFVYELVAGARRFRASKIAGLKVIPFVSRNLSDEEMLEVQLVENVQRDDLHPLEEGEGYQAMLKLPGYTVERIAEKTGKDQTTIYRRLALCALIPKLRKAFFEDGITHAHAILLCRHTPADQEIIDDRYLWEDQWDRGKKVGRIATAPRRLSSLVAGNLMLVLKSAPWNRDSKELVLAAGSCTACPKRSGSNRALFDDLGDNDDRCLDLVCYQSKLSAHIEAAINQNPKLVRIRKGYVHSEKLPAGAVDTNQYRDGSRKCPHREKAIVVQGDAVGHQVFICRSDNCKVHRLGMYSSKPTLAAVWKHKANELKEDIQATSRKAIMDACLAVIAQAGTKGTAGFMIATYDLVVALAGRRLIERLQNEHTKQLAKQFGVAKEEKKGYRPIEQAVQPHFTELTRQPSPGKALQFVAAAALIPSITEKKYYEERTGGDLLVIAAKSLKIDAAKITREVTAKKQAEFNKRRAAALKPAKKAKGKK